MRFQGQLEYKHYLERDQVAVLNLVLSPDIEYGLLPLFGEAGVHGESFRADEFVYLGQGRNELNIALGAGAVFALETH